MNDPFHHRWPIFEALTYIKQIINGLHMLHSQDIIHRDLKPANIYLNKDNVIKIADLGLSRKINNELAFS